MNNETLLEGTSGVTDVGVLTAMCVLELINHVHLVSMNFSGPGADTLNN